MTDPTQPATGPRDALALAAETMTAADFRDALRNPSSDLSQTIAMYGYRPLNEQNFWVDEDIDGYPEYERFDFVDESSGQERQLRIFTVYEDEAVDVLSSRVYGKGMYASLLADIQNLNEKKAVYDQAVAALTVANTGDGVQNTELQQAVQDAKSAVNMQDLNVLLGHFSIDEAAPHSATARYLALASTDANGLTITDPQSGKVRVSVWER